MTRPPRNEEPEPPRNAKPAPPRPQGKRLSDYDYNLPPELIAQRPPDQRDQSRLLVLERRTSLVTHRQFPDIAKCLKPGDLLVLNDTKVIPSRVRGERYTSGKIEALFLRELDPGRWEVLFRTGGKPRPGEVIELAGGRLSVRLTRKTHAGWIVTVARGTDVLGILREVGEIPLPPYIRRGEREDEAFHRDRYQTVFAREEGAVAAPTAGLHFTQTLLDGLRRNGVRTATITLHVGPGTFMPVRDDDITKHEMHREFYRISPEAAYTINETQSAGGRVVAVGTTSCRVLESCGERVESGEGWTDLFIYPPHDFRHVDVMLTNFHLPRSTLLMLVAAFAGRRKLLKAYRDAVASRYRFYSYGDAMLIV